jgi:hypothetical protein
MADKERKTLMYCTTCSAVYYRLTSKNAEHYCNRDFCQRWRKRSREYGILKVIEWLIVTIVPISTTTSARDSTAGYQRIASSVATLAMHGLLGKRKTLSGAWNTINKWLLAEIVVILKVSFCGKLLINSGKWAGFIEKSQKE